MNKRIKELAYAAKLDSHMLWTSDGNKLPDDMIKFAELIVQECSAINTATCKELKADESIKTPGFNTTTNLYMLTLRNNLSEHFGVE